MRGLLCISFLLFIMPMQAHAYIDPGSGSAIMSAIIGFFVVIGLTIKSYWYKLKSLFGGSNSSDPNSSSTTDE